MTVNKIDVIDMACDEYSQEVLGFANVIASGNPTPYSEPIVSTASPTLTPFGDSDFLLFEEADSFLALEDDPTSSEVDPTYQDPEGDILILEAILNSEPPLPFPNHEQYMPDVRKELKLCEAKRPGYTWTRFLKDKTEAFDQFKIFSKKIQNQLGCTIVSIRTNHGREFDNEVQFGEFYDANGITHNFSTLSTPQSNGVVERKNRTLQEISRTMLKEQSLPQKFWCNAVDTSTYILNRILIRVILGKTPYEILRGRKPTLDYFRVFGSKCFILNTKDYLTKFDPKSYEGVFLGYSQNSKAYIILNKHTRKIEESLNVTFDETPPPSKTSPLVDDDLDEEEAIREIEKKNLENNVEDETLEIDEVVNIKESRNHPLENVIGNLNQRTLLGILRKDLSRAGPTSGIRAWREPLLKKLYFHFTMTSQNPSQTYPMPSPLVSSFTFPSTSEPLFSASTSEPVFESPNHTQPSQSQQLQQYHTTTVSNNNAKFPYLKKEEYETNSLINLRDYVDREGTSGICTFVGCCLTSWFLKKQTGLSISTTEAKYVSAEKACQQALWMKQALINYDVRLNDVPIMCDNKGAIDLSKNPVQHSRTKHIEIRHCFLCDNVQKGHISIEKVPSIDNIAYILTKPLKRESFNYLHLGLGMTEHIS
ncbi:retrovirus-related pol polyprotein from transposon TNT 1-94 [Tanacetum coccineum]